MRSSKTNLGLKTVDGKAHRNGKVFDTLAAGTVWGHGPPECDCRKSSKKWTQPLNLKLNSPVGHENLVGVRIKLDLNMPIHARELVRGQDLLF